ncbi:pyridoxal 5'-phosphate synthase glutaminase subunit PdxT [Phosphitispora fastidiosa]|uniref:pyridoxal 5'-phosphate synthase glutaminase subunit PdxT n=1 Tax=Phosphitispora fastidiosa TaxID=2837202 RepID=UPI0022B0922F|nr:pyridoxal 5'-phosphate synthase glutaminase subunit PdxT [Phosphitispora fastidiosa]MBU7007569.1 5'-phosphate synthase pdxT subunit [Phosphitispora fastidiosa]
MRVGVLALQGAFIEHEKSLKSLGCETIQVRKREQLENIDGLIIPGGESTTIGKLMNDFDLIGPIKELAVKGLPIFGTCAGLIVMAKEIANSSQLRLGMMNITVQRNAFGRQVDSFETDLQIEGLGQEPFRAVFIRAPYIEKVSDGVEVLATVDEKIVFAREKNFLATAFHPELTDDTRVHEIFMNCCKTFHNLR